MGLLWPAWLLLIAAIPVIVLLYVLALRRRRRFAVHYSSLSLILQAMPGGIRWRRHVPFALFLIALLLLIVALSRPFANVTVASNQTTVMLALDASLSMCANDVEPNRIAVAQEAAGRFIEGLEPGTQVGVVAFAGIAQVIVAPTTDREALLQAIDNLTMARRTAVGSAIARSLDTLAEVNPNISPVRTYANNSQEQAGVVLEEALQPDVIVLLTDGANTSGVNPLTAAEAARDRGVRVYTIGFGTTSPSVLRCTPEQLGGDEQLSRIGRSGFGGGFGGGFAGGFGGRNFLNLDEDTLMSVADITGGEYYYAESADELLEVFATIPVHITGKKVRMEIAALLTAFGALFALGGVVLGIRWNPLP